MANEGMDYKQRNDRFHVMLNEQLDRISNFRTQITLINQNLTNAENSLTGIPGVDEALKGIDASKKENYQRLANAERAEQAVNDLFMAMAEKYTVLEQATSALTIPQAANQNPRLTTTQQAQATNQNNQ